MIESTDLGTTPDDAGSPEPGEAPELIGSAEHDRPADESIAPDESVSPEEGDASEQDAPPEDLPAVDQDAAADAQATDEQDAAPAQDATAGTRDEGTKPRRAGRSRRATRPTSAPEHDAETASGPLDVLAELSDAAPGAPRETAPTSAEALDTIVFSAPPRGADGAPGRGRGGARPELPDDPAVAGSAGDGPKNGATPTEGAVSTEDGGSTASAAPTDSAAPTGSATSTSSGESGNGDTPAPDTAAPPAVSAGEPGLDAPTAEAGPRLPVTALLFQAPDLTSAASRSRRAQSPAGPPTFDAEPAPGRGPDARDATTPSSQEEVDEEGSGEEPADESSAASAGAQRRRRRRGGRGRRNRSAADQGDGTAEDEEEDGGSDDDTGDEQQAEGPRADRGGGQRQRRRQPRTGDARKEAAQEADERDAAPSAGDDAEAEGEQAGGEGSGSSSSRRRRRRRRGSRQTDGTEPSAAAGEAPSDEVTALKGSTRLEAKRQRRREGRDAGRRRTVVTEAEFLARRESVERSMVVRERGGRTQIAVLEDGVLVEHFVARRTQTSMVGNVYLGRVQNVLPSMEAAFVDLGKGRNAVLYAGEVNWDAAGMEGQPRRIEQALSSGDSVMVQVTKDPIGHKGARLTSQITLAGRYLVLVPSGAMTGISRKLPDTERARLKKLLRDIVPDGAGVIVRTAAEGASEEELRLDVARLQVQWAEIERKAKSASAPSLLHGEPDLAIRVVRDVFNEDFGSVTISGDEAWDAIAGYIESVAPDLAPRLHRWTSDQDVFAANRIDEQLAKALDRKVWLPSGGSLVIDRTEAMTVVDVNTGKFTGAGGTLEETVTRNNLEAAEEIVRQLRLRDIGGIIVIDFIDMVLESNRDLVLRRLVECLGRDRTRHQVAEVTSLGLVQMTRKRVGQGLIEAFSETCEVCSGRGYLVHSEPVEKAGRTAPEPAAEEVVRSGSRRRGRRATDATGQGGRATAVAPAPDAAAREAVKATLATIAAAAAHAHEGTEHGAGAAAQPVEIITSALESAVGLDGAAAFEGDDEPDPVIDFDLIRSSLTGRLDELTTAADTSPTPSTPGEGHESGEGHEAGEGHEFS